MSNEHNLKIIDNCIIEWYNAYNECNLLKVNKINFKVLEMVEIPKKHKDKQHNNIMTHIIGNDKIGEDTLCINISSGLNCPMNILNKCSNSNICYACNQNKQYFKNTVPKNIINQTIINKIILRQITLHEVLNNLVHDIICEYTNKQINNLKFLRFNVEGDILNNDILKVCDTISHTLKTVFNLKECYTYTHNYDLNFKIAENIVINCSDFKKQGYKSVHTIDRLNKKLIKKIINKSVILCSGDCNNCSYCKNKKDLRPIYFLKHGGKYMGIENIKNNIPKLYNFIEYNKKIDYNNFIGGYNE